MTPIKAIRAKCLDCCCNSAHEVRLCTCVNCALWPYRFGKRPSTLAKHEGAPNGEIAMVSALQNKSGGSVAE